MKNSKNKINQLIKRHMIKISDKYKLIMKSQLVGWLIYFLIQVSFGLAYTENVNEVYHKIIFYKLFYSLSGFTIILLFSKFCFFLAEKIKVRIYLILVVSISTYLLTYLWNLSSDVINDVVWGNELTLHWKYHFIGVLYASFYQFCGFVALFYLVNYWYETVIQKQKVLEATSLLQQAQLQMLRYQLNPHFLFNSLNSLRALIIKDQMKAREMVTSLSEFIRYSLISDQEEEVTIEKEMAVIRKFIDIQKIRFGKNLDVNIDIKPETANIKIPSFLIHTLVENAIKYGIETSSKPLKLKIEAIYSDNQLIIKIANSGKLVEPPATFENNQAASGTGLININKRLANKYLNKFSFELTEDDGWVNATIGIQK